MFWQNEMLREGVNMSLNDTYMLDLPDNGLLGSIMLIVNGSQVDGQGLSGGKWRLLDYLSKIEIVLNGATICKSIKGDMVQALAFYDNGVTAPDDWRNFTVDYHRCYLMIDFGRYLHDLGAGLDLSKFKSVELKLTNDATASEFSALDVSAMAIWAREYDAGFPFYMRTEEWRKWTTVQGEIKYHALPSAHTIRRIILQAKQALDADNLANTTLGNLMHTINLQLRSGMTQVFNGGLNDIMRLNLYRYGRNLLTGASITGSAGKGFDIGLGYPNYIAHGAGARNAVVATVVPTMESARVETTQKPVSFEADKPICIMGGGMAYHNSVVLDFDQVDDPSTWIDPEKVATVTLDITTRDTAASASGTNKIILDRAVSAPVG